VTIDVSEIKRCSKLKLNVPFHILKHSSILDEMLNLLMFGNTSRIYACIE
jgi:hypothetical protein